MTQYQITHGSHVVIITEQCGLFSCRLYVNWGETATLSVGSARTRAGIERSARRLLGVK